MIIDVSQSLLESFFSPNDIAIKSATKVRSMIHLFISAPNCHSFAAVSQEGEVVGYAVVRTLLKKEHGWRVGPLFADNSQIARSLYRAMIETVASTDPATTITIDIPYGDGCNPDGLGVARELSGQPGMKFVRMYRGVPCTIPILKVFGVTSLCVG